MTTMTQRRDHFDHIYLLHHKSFSHQTCSTNRYSYENILHENRGKALFQRGDFKHDN